MKPQENTPRPERTAFITTTEGSRVKVTESALIEAWKSLEANPFKFFNIERTGNGTVRIIEPQILAEDRSRAAASVPTLH